MGPAAGWLIFFSSSTPGSRLAQGPVAEQIDEIISLKNPQNCVGGIRVMIGTCYMVSRFTAPYEIHSYSVYLSKCYFLVFYNSVEGWWKSISLGILNI